jgi:hypothetical protein
MRLWKVLGLGAFAGVAATGAVIARNERRRRAYTPDEVRDKLHARLAAAPADSAAAPADPAAGPASSTAAPAAPAPAASPPLRDSRP